MKNGPYELVKAPDNYPGALYRGKYVYEHHLVWWQSKKEVISTGFVLHHKNENKRDNRIENLELKTRGAHTSEHNQERKADDVELVCPFCQKKFFVEIRYLKSKTKNGHKIHCSRSCSGKASHIGR